MNKYVFRVVCVGPDISRLTTKPISANTLEEAWEIIRRENPNCTITYLGESEI